MTIDRFFSWSGAALVLLSVVGICVALDAPWLLLAGGGLVVVSRLVTEGPRGRVLSRRMSLLCTLVAAGFSGVSIAMAPSDPLPAIATFGLWLTVIKCFERRTIENEAERLVLSFLLIAVSAMVSMEALFGVVFLLWVPLAIVVLLLFQVQYGRASVGRSSRGGSTGAQPAGPRVRRHLAMVVGIDTCAMLAVATGLFLLFPRGLTPELSTASAAGIARTAAGTSQRLNLVSGARIVSTDVEVARVEQLEGPSPSGGVLRLRTGTMSEYTGRGGWHPTYFTFVKTVPVMPTWSTLDASPIVTPISFTIDLQRQMKYLPVPAGLRRIRADRSTRVDWDQVRGVVASMPNNVPMRYSVEADAAAIPASFGMRGSAEWSDSRVLQLAQRILSEAQLPSSAPSSPRSRKAWIDSASRAFVEYLRSGRYQYTLDLTRVGQDDEIQFSKDPVTRFLLEEPVGHCEYFAAGFTALAKSVGIPSRIVTGFVAFDRDEQGRWIVRERDAHAWSEVLAEPGVWVAFDATPSAGPIFQGQSGDQSLMAKWARLRSALELWWYGDVLGYDASAQQMLAESVFPGWKQWLADSWRWFSEQRTRLDLFFGFGSVGTVWFIVVVSLCGGGGYVLFRRRRRRRVLANLVGLSGVHDPRLRSIAFYGETLRLLDRAGLGKPSHCSPLAWARTLWATNTEAAQSLEWLSHVVYRRRFGHGDETSALAIDAQLSALAKSLGLRRGRGT